MSAVELLEEQTRVMGPTPSANVEQPAGEEGKKARDLHRVASRSTQRGVGTGHYIC